MNGIDRLLAIEAIHVLKARYFRLVDTKQWDGFAALFAEDIAFDLTDSGFGVLTGVEAVMARVKQSFDGCVSVHHGFTPEIDILSDDRAAGVWAMEDLLVWAGDAGQPETTLHGYGHYHETYDRHEDGWRISTLTLKRLRVDLTTRTIYR